MGCGCGKKTASRVRSTQTTTVSRPPNTGNNVQVAQTYQSATIRKAPQGPVGRKTV